jgi:predicted solute-binding protein
MRQFLDASLAAGLADLRTVATQCAIPGWSTDEMEGYLRRFHYRFGPEDLAGLARYEELLQRHELLVSD